MLRVYENGGAAAAAAVEPFWKAKSRSLINPSAKGLFPVFSFPVEGISYVWPEQNSECATS